MTGVHPTLAQIRVLLADELTGATAEQLARHPDADSARWSAQQVIEHLMSSRRLTAASVEERLGKRMLQTRATLGQRVGQIAVCECGYFPRGRKSPAAVMPKEDGAVAISGNALVQQVSEQLTDMSSVLDRMEVQAGGADVLTHPVLGPLSVRRWRRFHLVHARHHLQQIRDALQGPNRSGAAAI
jgi:hypothetical protein